MCLCLARWGRWLQSSHFILRRITCVCTSPRCEQCGWLCIYGQSSYCSKRVSRSGISYQVRLGPSIERYQKRPVTNATSVWGKVCRGVLSRWSLCIFGLEHCIWVRCQAFVHLWMSKKRCKPRRNFTSYFILVNSQGFGCAWKHALRT